MHLRRLPNIRLAPGEEMLSFAEFLAETTCIPQKKVTVFLHISIPRDPITETENGNGT